VVTGSHDDWLGIRTNEIAERLDAIGEELTELAIEILRAALADRAAAGSPAPEKRITQARRAVEKAAHVLRSVPGDGPDLQ
jgi:hypothetical protein